MTDNKINTDTEMALVFSVGSLFGAALLKVFGMIAFVALILTVCYRLYKIYKDSNSNNGVDK